MNKTLTVTALLAAFATAPQAQAEIRTYNILTTWYEPDTQPKNAIFAGAFDYDTATHQVTHLSGDLSESMTGVFPFPAGDTAQYPAPLYDQTLLHLTYQMSDWVASYSGPAKAPPSTNWHQDDLGGTFATVFLKDTTHTYSTMMGGNGWSPASGVANMGLYHGFPFPYATSIQNAYALVFVPDGIAGLAPGASLTLHWNEAAGTGDLGLAYTSYADCAPGGMMGAVCMSSWSVRAYDSVGTMSGYPLSQTITAAPAAPVPEPASYAMWLAGLSMMGVIVRRRGTGT